MTDHCKGITLNGRPLHDVLAEEFGVEVSQVRIKIIGEIKKTLPTGNKQLYQGGGIGSGRTRGNPGVKKARVLSITELQEEAARRGMTLSPRKVQP
jgi:hypothetical protein